MSRPRGREAAFRILFAAEFQDEPSAAALAAYEGIHGVLPEAGRRYALDLLDGVAGARAEIDREIEATSEHWRLDRMGRVERTALRLGAFEILRRDDVPDPVAIDCAVELAKVYGGQEAAAFVNGILDALMRRKAPSGASA
jgi:N utilization substance protein B